LAHFADSSRTSSEVREAPQADICSAANEPAMLLPCWHEFRPLPTLHDK